MNLTRTNCVNSWLTKSLCTRPRVVHRRGASAQEKTLTETKMAAEQNPKDGSTDTRGGRVLATAIVLFVLALLIYVWICAVAKLL